MGIEKRIRRKLDALLSTEIEVTGKGYEFRASSLPFCPRAMVIDAALQKKDEAPSGSRSHKMESIFSMGHGFHSATQHWFGAAGLLFGHWKCQAPLDRKRYRKLREQAELHASDPVIGPALLTALEKPVCGTLVRNDYLPGTKRAKTRCCPTCGNDQIMRWQYVEYTVSDPKTGMSAHPDGYLPRFKAILELKTTGSKYMKARTEPNWEHWIYQASVYGTLLQEQENLPVKRIVLVYAGRENIEHKVFVRPLMKHVLPTTRKMYLRTKEQIKLNVLPSGICTTQGMAKWEMECPYASMCFHPNLAKQLDLKKAHE